VKPGEHYPLTMAHERQSKTQFTTRSVGQSIDLAAGTCVFGRRKLLLHNLTRFRVISSISELSDFCHFISFLFSHTHQACLPFGLPPKEPRTILKSPPKKSDSFLHFSTSDRRNSWDSSGGLTGQIAYIIETQGRRKRDQTQNGNHGGTSRGCIGRIGGFCEQTQGMAVCESFESGEEP
jgi:hypothetical protein